MQKPRGEKKLALQVRQVSWLKYGEYAEERGSPGARVPLLLAHESRQLNPQEFCEPVVNTDIIKFQLNELTLLKRLVKKFK